MKLGVLSSVNKLSVYEKNTQSKKMPSEEDDIKLIPRLDVLLHLDST